MRVSSYCIRLCLCPDSIRGANMVPTAKIRFFFHIPKYFFTERGQASGRFPSSHSSPGPRPSPPGSCSQSVQNTVKNRCQSCGQSPGCRTSTFPATEILQVIHCRLPSLTFFLSNFAASAMELFIPCATNLTGNQVQVFINRITVTVPSMDTIPVTDLMILMNTLSLLYLLY